MPPGRIRRGDGGYPRLCPVMHRPAGRRLRVSAESGVFFASCGQVSAESGCLAGGTDATTATQSRCMTPIRCGRYARHRPVGHPDSADIFMQSAIRTPHSADIPRHTPARPACPGTHPADVPPRRPPATVRGRRPPLPRQFIGRQRRRRRGPERAFTTSPDPTCPTWSPPMPSRYANGLVPVPDAHRARLTPERSRLAQLPIANRQSPIANRHQCRNAATQAALSGYLAASAPSSASG